VGGRGAEQPRRRRRLRKLTILQQELFSPDFGFSYDTDLTLTAAEAFGSRRGNCLSFTSMFVAMARSAGIPTFLMSVRRDPEVDRVGDLVVVNRHVVAGYRGASSEVHIFDFYVTTTGPYIQQRTIDDVTATAMFHTNLGGDAIRRGELEEAVRHLGIATALAPSWAPGWVNLGVAHYRQGDAERAFAAYQRALEVDPSNSSALGNMACIYRDQGRDHEAGVALRAAAQQTTNPFTLVAMADAEMARGRWAPRAATCARRAGGTAPSPRSTWPWPGSHSGAAARPRLPGTCSARPISSAARPRPRSDRRHMHCFCGREGLSLTV